MAESAACDAKIRPFPNPTELICELADPPHHEHSSTLRDYAFPGSETVVTWLESDRRTFRGEWQPCDAQVGTVRCVLPLGHLGRHEP